MVGNAKRKTTFKQAFATLEDFSLFFPPVRQVATPFSAMKNVIDLRSHRHQQQF